MSDSRLERALLWAIFGLIVLAAFSLVPWLGLVLLVLLLLAIAHPRASLLALVALIAWRIARRSRV